MPGAINHGSSTALPFVFHSFALTRASPAMCFLMEPQPTKSLRILQQEEVENRPLILPLPISLQKILRLLLWAIQRVAHSMYRATWPANGCNCHLTQTGGQILMFCRLG